MKNIILNLLKNNGFYGLLIYLFYISYRKINKDKLKIMNYIYSLLYIIPFIRKRVNKKLKDSSQNLENELSTTYTNLFNIPNFPYTKNSIKKRIEEMKSKKIILNKVSGIIYHGGENHIKKLTDIFDQFSITNPLHPDLFPSIRNMEIDVINMVISLFKGDNKCCGNMTYGGTESILLACLTYRDYFRKNKNISKPNIVCIESIHPAFDKAGHYFGIELRKLKEGDHNFEDFIDSNTILLVGSAPSYAHGIVDPIKKLANIAKKYKIGLHIDSCMGGFLIPFIKDYQYINFKLDGITSISIDTHKYGYSLKGSSVLLFKNLEIKKFQHYINKTWNGGVYATPTLMGSKSGGLIASAWASLLYIGHNNFQDYANNIRNNLVMIKKRFDKNNNIQIIGNPNLNIIAFESNNLNIYSIIDKMKKKNWNLTVMQNPSSFHLCLTKLHDKETCNKFCEDLESSIKIVEKSGEGKLEGTLSLYGSSQALKDSFFIDEIIHDFVYLLSRKFISNRYE